MNIRPEEKEKLMNSSVEEKIQKSKQVISEALSRYPHGKLAIAMTGGKDSTLLLWLYKQVCEEKGLAMPPCMFINEGDVFNEIFEQVDQITKAWGLTVHFCQNHDVSDKAEKIGDPIRVADLNDKNRAEVDRLEYTEETFPFDPESYVGNHLMKTVAMNEFLETHKIEALSTAIRWDEQTARKEEDHFSPREQPDHVRVQGILHFNERDVWNATHTHQIPFCSLYKLGYRSLGAKCGTGRVSDIPAWEQDLENTTEREARGQDKEEIMEQLRGLGYM